MNDHFVLGPAPDPEFPFCLRERGKERHAARAS
jgi:hypothetical protein